MTSAEARGPGAVFLGLTCIALHGCAAPSDVAIDETRRPAEPLSAEAIDDGSYLSRIDPLGGQWRVDRLGDSDFTQFGAWVNFSSGGFINHGAGCAGGYPAFYRLDGQRVTVTRREPVRIGQCAGTAALAKGSAEMRQAAAESERRLAFVHRSAWRMEAPGREPDTDRARRQPCDPDAAG